MKINILWTIPAIMLLSGPASAACTGPAFRFYPAQNDTVPVSKSVTGGTCVISFSAGSSLRYTSGSVVSAPSHGKLKKSGVSSFNYAAQKNYKGSDQFVLKLCATTVSGNGCSTLRYAMSMN